MSRVRTITTVPDWLKKDVVIIKKRAGGDERLPQHLTVIEVERGRYDMVLGWDMFDELCALKLETALAFYRVAKPDDALGEWCTAFRPGEGANSESVFLQVKK